MDVTPTEEQRLLVSATRSFAQRFATTDGVTVPDTAEAWRVAAEMGLPGLLVPAELNGGAARALDAALVVEETARRLVPVPLLGTLLAAELVVAAGSTAGVAEQGRAEPGGAEPDRAADAVALAAGWRAGCVVLDGDLLAPAPGGIAWDWSENALVLGVHGDGSGAWTVTEAVAGGALDSIDRLRALARAQTGDRRLGTVTAERVARWTALALALVCADLVGTMTGALDGAVAHARVREQFGRPVGSFQAVQHLAAEQHALIEGARSCTWHAAWAVDALSQDEALQAGSVAKAYCSEIARPVTEAAIQIYGGLGMTWDCVAHLYLRRALLDRRTLGDEEHHLAAIASRRLGCPDDRPDDRPDDGMGDGRGAGTDRARIGAR